MGSDARAARRILEGARTIAVLGAHQRASRPGHYVAAYLKDQGYRVLPVNPRFAGEVLFGERVRSSLSELEHEVDVIDVFRRAELLPQHLDEILAMQPLPRVVWLQSGIKNDAFAKELEGHGIEVVQDRCTYADHRNFGLPPISAA